VSERRLATILAIDVVGYSALTQRYGEAVVSALNDVFRLLVRPQVKEYHGRVVKLSGDGALVEFKSARDAVICAAQIQKEMRSDRPPYSFSEQLLLRMGIHAGDVVVNAGDVFGDGVNIAARLEAAAPPGEVFISSLVADLAGGDLPVSYRSEGPRRYKNIEKPVETLSVVLDTSRDLKFEQPRVFTQIEQFVKTADGVTLAWAETGSGPPIVRAPAWISRLDLDSRLPYLSHWIDFFSKTHRFIRFDARGNGLSDRDIPAMSFELMVEDMRAVFDASGIEKASLFGTSQGAAIAAAFAAKYPDRVSSIIMFGGFPQGRLRRKSAKDAQKAVAMQAMMKAGWDDDYPSLRDLMADIIVPLATREDRRQFAEDMKSIVSPEIMSQYRAALDDIDINLLLEDVKAPCLVMHCSGDRMHPIAQGRMMAAGLPNARFVPFDSVNHLPTENDPCWPLIQREINEFWNLNPA
jgi:class 3 adenylate cyclase/pimeloyl-ACP methyl ester carboxylesterase